MYERVSPYWPCLYICQNQIKECLITFRHLSFLRRDISKTSYLWVFAYFLQCKKKWSVASVSEPQSQIELGASLKLWRNLCLFKWLNFNRSLHNNLTPTGSWIAKRDLCFKLKNCLNMDVWYFHLLSVSCLVCTIH